MAKSLSERERRYLRWLEHDGTAGSKDIACGSGLMHVQVLAGFDLLESRGLVTSEVDKARFGRVYKITRAGRKALRRWDRQTARRKAAADG